MCMDANARENIFETSSNSTNGMLPDATGMDGLGASTYLSAWHLLRQCFTLLLHAWNHLSAITSEAQEAWSVADLQDADSP